MTKDDWFSLFDYLSKDFPIRPNIIYNVFGSTASQYLIDWWQERRKDFKVETIDNDVALW